MAIRTLCQHRGALQRLDRPARARAEMLQGRRRIQARARQRQGHARIKCEVRIDERVIGIAVLRDASGMTLVIEGVDAPVRVFEWDLK